MNKSQLHSDSKQLFEFPKFIFRVLFFLICTFVAFNHSYYIDLFNATFGSGALPFTWYITWPERFEQDFLGSFVGNLRFSAFMSHYGFFFNFFEIDPVLMERIQIFLQTFFFSIAVLWFSRFVHSRVDRLTQLLIVGTALLSNVLNCSLSQWPFPGNNYALAYTVAACLQVMCLVMSFRRQWLVLALALSALVWIHVSIGAATTVVVFGVCLADFRKNIRDKKFWLALVLFSFLASIWVFGFLGVGQAHFNVLDTETWVKWVRFSNYHFFPFSLPVFTTGHAKGLTPVLAFFLIALSHPDPGFKDKKVYRRWYFSLWACLLIIIIGLAATLFPFSTTLIRLALPRIIGLMLLLCLPLAIDHIILLLQRRNAFWQTTALGTLASPFLLSFGFPLLFSWLIAFPIFLSGSPVPKGRRIVCFSVYIVSIVYTIFLWSKGYAQLFDVALTAGPIMLLSILGLMVVLGVASHYQFVPRHWQVRVIPWVSILILIVGGWNFSRNTLDFKNADEALSYKEAQLWAEKNTPVDSLFMHDPSRHYGWRDFSRRASFGVMREWIHLCIVYEPNEERFREGMRRIKLFGVDPEPFLDRSIQAGNISVGKDYYMMRKEVENAYNNMSTEQLRDISLVEGIDYYVFHKSRLKQELAMPIVYENEHYYIFAVQNHVKQDAL